MIVPFNIGFAFNPDSPPLVNARVLSVLLENLIQVDMVYLQCMRDVGRAVPELHRSGVVYGRTKLWESIPDVIARGYADCKSLTAWFVAQVRDAAVVQHGATMAQARGMAKPVFRWVRNTSNGQRDFHILVQTPTGWRDPSKDLGMNQYNQFIERGA